jgi:hypothetical protein
MFDAFWLIDPDFLFVLMENVEFLSGFLGVSIGVTFFVWQDQGLGS